MKITASLFALAAAQSHGIEHDHHLNGAGVGLDTLDEVINENNIRADGQQGSNRAQITRAPTAAPLEGETLFTFLRSQTNSLGLTDVWELPLAGSSDCQMYVDGDNLCVADSGGANGQYGNSETCVFSLKVDAQVQVHQFQTESYFDEMYISESGQWNDWTVHSGTTAAAEAPNPQWGWYDDSLANSQYRPAGSEFRFQTDGSVIDAGFAMCVVSTPTAPPELGNTDQIDAQGDLTEMPTAYPTRYPTKTNANRWVITSSSNQNVCHATVTEDGNCILDDPNDALNYNNQEECNFEWAGEDATAYAEHFDLEANSACVWDHLSFNGVKYCGTGGYLRSLPSSFDVVSGTAFQFKTDYSVTKPGFKICVRETGNRGSNCVDGDFVKPIGWVGAGNGNQFCNIWKCDQKGDGAAFTKQAKTCSIEEHGNSFCSHTSCTFETNTESGNVKVINVRSDHRETVGGYHKCGFARHAKQGGFQDNESGAHLDTDNKGGNVNRPACDCICFGMDSNEVPAALRRTAPRRQDESGFERTLNEISGLFAFLQGQTNTLGLHDVWEVPLAGSSDCQMYVSGDDLCVADSGGANGHYGNFETCVFKLKVEAQVEVRQFNTEVYFDNMEISENGATTTTHSGTTAGGESWSSFRPDDQLDSTIRPANTMFRFTTDVSVLDAGFAMCVVSTPSTSGIDVSGDRVVADAHDATTDANAFDTAHNSNNLYSQHANNNAPANYPGAHTQVASRTHSSPTGDAQTVTETLSTAETTNYNENDHTYAGQRVAHVHIDS